MRKYILSSLLLLVILPFGSAASAEHVFLNPEAFAQYLDISQLESDKFTLTFDDVSYDLYYGYHGSLDSMGSDSQYPTLSSMEINQESKSLEIFLDDVPERTDFWVRMPFEVISAENENYQVLVDGIDTPYDLMKFPDAYVVGVFIPEGTKHVEVIGTHVIPEFDALSILPLGVLVVLLVIFLMRRNQKITVEPRIN